MNQHTFRVGSPTATCGRQNVGNQPENIMTTTERSVPLSKQKAQPVALVPNLTPPATVADLELPHILRKPVYWVDTHPINEDSGFIHKRLCDGPTFTPGTACAYSCKYCYVESMVLKQHAVASILKEAGHPFNRLVIRRREVLRNLAQDLTRKRRKSEQGHVAETTLTPDLIQRWGLNGNWSLADRAPKYDGRDWDGKVIFGSPLVDVASTKVLAQETTEMCEMILRLTNLHIRLLSKSPLLAEVAKELHKRLPDDATGAKARVVFGFSTGTIEDKIARAIETHAPSPSARINALHWLQDNGFRTYGMLCPILPQKDAAAYTSFAQTAMEKIRADQCEEIWAEAVNFRVGSANDGKDQDQEQERTSFKATLQALLNGGFTNQATLFETVANDPAAWESYSRTLFEVLASVAPYQSIPRLIVGEKMRAERPAKLWWLHYPRTFESIHDYWGNQQVRGALLMGAVMTRYRKPKKKAATKVATMEAEKLATS